MDCGVEGPDSNYWRLQRSSAPNPSKILAISSIDGLRPNVKFAWAFPYFGTVHEWKNKIEALGRLRQNPEVLLEFSASTNMRKSAGGPILQCFVDGPIRIQQLVSSGQLQFLLVKSPEDVVLL